MPRICHVVLELTDQIPNTDHRSSPTLLISPIPPAPTGSFKIGQQERYNALDTVVGLYSSRLREISRSQGSREGPQVRIYVHKNATFQTKQYLHYFSMNFRRCQNQWAMPMALWPGAGKTERGKTKSLQSLISHVKKKFIAQEKKDWTLLL